MVATLLPQLRERTADVEKGHLSGLDLKSEVERLQTLVDGLHERVDKLPSDQFRTDYTKTVDEAFAKLKSAKPKTEENDKKEEKEDKPSEPEPKKVTPPAPATPPAPKKP